MGFRLATAVSEERKLHPGPNVKTSEIKCSCGEEFKGISKAKAHLRNVSGDRPPVKEVPPQPSWNGEAQMSGIAEYQLNQRGCIGQVLAGHEFFIETARSMFSPPPNYAVEEWDHLDTLENHEGALLFNPDDIKRALAWLTRQKQDYNPERYSVYFRGYAPLYMEGGGRAVCVAPRSKATTH